VETLRFENVSKSFGEQAVLRGLSAEVPLTGVSFVVGRSGSGKSVLCRMAVGLLKPDAGEVSLLGEPVHSLPERALIRLRARVPYLVQGPALLDWLTLLDNVKLANPDGGEDKAREALARVGLAEVADRFPPEVGPGVKKRAAIARALLLNPKFLLLDEPTTGLDRAAAGQVNAALQTLKAQGLGALVVSHDYRALEALADHVLEVREGVVGYQGNAHGFLAAR
jgi:phospholipid/cholesterol/gamma-HCH transport system ATP-binding protein